LQKWNPNQNPNDEFPNSEGSTNDEKALDSAVFFGVRYSGFFGHSEFGFRHFATDATFATVFG